MTLKLPIAPTRDVVAEFSLNPITALARLHGPSAKMADNLDLLNLSLLYIQRSPGLLKAITSRSYWHNNGFAKIVLIERSSYSLRLHVWPEGTNRQGDTNPHKHRWNFASWIAVGPGMIETYFSETDHTDPNAKLHIRCEYGHGAWRHALRPRGPAWLRQAVEIIRPAGEVYMCSTDILHTVVPLGHELMATIVVQGKALHDTTEVFLDQRRPQYDSLPITAADLGDLLIAVRRAISHAG